MVTNFADKIAFIEKELRETPYHKGTEHHLGRLKARLAKLKNRLEQSQKRGGGKGFFAKKQGDATIVLLGPPSVGKSTLLNKLTRAHSRVESWPFTTLTVIPGMFQYQGANIQILDLPGIVDGGGGGAEVLSVARVADLLLLIIDIKNLNKISSILADLKKVKISCPLITIINKVDLLNKISLSKNEDSASAEGSRCNKNQIFISAKTGLGLERLKKRIWEELRLLRIYLKPRWGKVDFRSPLILKKGQTVADVAKKIFLADKEFKKILLWGPSAQFPGQPISLNHELKDKDILSFI